MFNVKFSKVMDTFILPCFPYKTKDARGAVNLKHYNEYQKLAARTVRSKAIQIDAKGYNEIKNEIKLGEIN